MKHKNIEKVIENIEKSSKLRKNHRKHKKYHPKHRKIIKNIKKILENIEKSSKTEKKKKHRDIKIGEKKIRGNLFPSKLWVRIEEVKLVELSNAAEIIAFERSTKRFLTNPIINNTKLLWSTWSKTSCYAKNKKNHFPSCQVWIAHDILWSLTHKKFSEKKIKQTYNAISRNESKVNNHTVHLHSRSSCNSPW